MNNSLRLTVITLLLAVSSLSAATLYVSPGSTNTTLPFTNWATAAPDIQAAVYAAEAGDTVLVTNGVYNQRQCSVGNEQCRVAITKAITLLSVNGPQFTVINGGGGLHCAYLTDGATLSGFTLADGWANLGGGVWSTSRNAFLTNCTLAGNATSGGAGGAYGGTLYNCTLSDNQGGLSAGGAYESTLYNCTLIGNWGGDAAGGALDCTLYSCTLVANSSDIRGGGADSSTLYNCTLRDNSAGNGGGAIFSTLYNCTLGGQPGCY